MRVRGKGMGKAKSVIYSFSGVIFFSKCIHGILGVKKKAYFSVSNLWMTP